MKNSVAPTASTTPSARKRSTLQSPIFKGICFHVEMSSLNNNIPFSCVPNCGKVGFLKKTLESMKELLMALVMIQEKGGGCQRIKQDGAVIAVLPSAGSYFMLVDAVLNYFENSKDHPVSDSVEVLGEQIRALIMPHELSDRKDQLAGKPAQPLCTCCRSETGSREQNELATSLAADLFR